MKAPANSATRLLVVALLTACAVTQHDSSNPAVPRDRTLDSGVMGTKAGTASMPSNGPGATPRDMAPDAAARQGNGHDDDAGAAPDALAMSEADAGTGEETRLFVYVGGWDWESSTYPFRGFELRLPAGTWTPLADANDLGPNPSFIAVSKDQHTLYVTNERDDENGGITAANIDENNGALQRIDRQPAVGGGFVFASLDPSERYLLASSYNGGSISVFAIDAGGRFEVYG